MKHPSLHRRRHGKGDMGTDTARRHPEGWHRWEVLATCCSLFLLFYIWICYENFHFHVTHFYAHLGYPGAQHLVGQRYLRGVGVQRNQELAAHWLRSHAPIMDITTYLQRIGIAATSAAPSLVALRDLHRQHVLSIPFENLSIHSGEKIILDLPLVYDKIVVQKRGGFCYKTNGIFLWVLQVLGYRPHIMSARVWNKTVGGYGPPTHMLLTVELEGRQWLCDVGFGEGIREPIPIEPGWEGKQESGIFRLQEDQGDWSLEEKEDDGWRSLYIFTLEEYQYEDFRWACEYHQTSPSSIMFCKSLCRLQLPRGRLTYLGNRLISTEFTEEGRTMKTTQVLTNEEIPAVLRDRFGIVLRGKLVPKDDKVQATSFD